MDVEPEMRPRINGVGAAWRPPITAYHAPGDVSVDWFIANICEALFKARWFNFACGANYPYRALKGGYFVFVWSLESTNLT